MERLYDLFQQAPTLGSLLDPRTVAEDLFALGFDALKGTVERALKRIEARTTRPGRPWRRGQGIALAASLMAREFTLVATNVPYLTRGKQAEELRDYIADVHSAAKADLATAFVERCLEYCARAARRPSLHRRTGFSSAHTRPFARGCCVSLRGTLW